MACAATDVDDLFDPSPTSGGAAGKGGSSQTGGSGGSSTGGTGGSTGGTGGGVTGGTGGTGGTATGGTGGVGGTGGTVTGGAGGTTGGTGGTGGAGGTAGTSVDAGVDVRRDAAADVRDAGKSGIRCGTTTCDSATQFCCLANNNIRCLGSASTMCTSSTDRLHCDDTTDCAVGQVCCVTEGIGGNGADAVCIAATLGCAAPKQMLCDPAVTAPCLNLANLVCSANGSGILQDYAYCHVP